MAILNENADGGTVSNAASITVAHEVSAAAPNRAIFAQCFPPSATEATAIDSIAHDGLALTLIDRVENIRFSKDLHVFYRINPNTGSGLNIVANFPAAADQAVLQVWSATGINQSTPYTAASWQQQNGPGTGPTVTVPSATGNVVLGGLAIQNSGATVTPGTGVTVLEDHEVSSNGTYRAVLGRKDGAASVVFNFTLGASINYGIWGLEINAAAGGGASTGDAALAIPALTLSADGAVEVQGSAALNIPALTLSAAGAAAVQGAAAVSLPALQVTADGAVQVQGAAALTIPMLTLQAAGGGAVLVADAALTLPALQLTAEGMVEVGGTAALQLPALSVTAAGTIQTHGSAALNLPALTSAGSGSVEIQGAAALTIPALTVSATGSELEPEPSQTATPVARQLSHDATARPRTWTAPRRS